MTVQLALYRGPGHTPLERLTHWLTCAVISLKKMRWETHSHAELVVNGVSCSSSLRDRGVRAKVIEFGDHWDLYPVDVEPETVLQVFDTMQLLEYDTCGALAWAWPGFVQAEDKVFCFEAVAKMLRIPEPDKQSALDLLQYVKELNSAKA
jgi:hypothetical protein